MTRLTWLAAAALACLFAAAPPALPCGLCPGSLQNLQTLRQEMEQSRLVLYGTMANPRLNPGDGTFTGAGATDFHILRVVKPDPILGNRKVIEVPRYIPVLDPKDPPKFVVLCDVINGKLDANRGRPAKSAAVIGYLEGARTLEGKDRTQTLLYYFAFLDHKDEDISTDAYLEFAKASDQEIGQVARKLSADKLRRLLQDPKTPAERLGLYAFLLGACGGDKDADLLRALLERPTEKTVAALDGILGGYIFMRPRQGWDLAVALLADGRRPFPERYAVVRTLRFYHAWQPAESRREVLRGLAVMLDQGDVADLAIEDLRRWQVWDLTDRVLAQYGKKSHSAPILRRAMVRYALSCPNPAAARFVAEIRKQDPELIKELEEDLKLEKQG
jgi:hypothetical protein